MTRENFIKELSKCCGANRAEEIANDFTDEELDSQLLNEIKEDYRFAVQYEHYINHGY